MNNNLDVMLKEKIEKREKIDTIIAYVLMVILVGCIILVLVLKFTDKDEEDIVQEEYTPNYISLSEISNSLNRLVLDNNDSVSSSVSGNSIVIDYVNEEDSINLSIPMVGNELMFTIEEDNNEIVTDIYKEVASIICVYYGNEDKYCKNTLDNMSDNGNDSIRIINNENNSVVYIDTTKSYTVNREIVHNDVTKVKLDDTNYVLNMLDVRVSNISVTTSDTGVKVSGNTEMANEDDSSVSVLVKLYDKDGNVIGENNSTMGNTNTFEVEFLVSDTLKLEDIYEYSIEIVK